MRLSTLKILASVAMLLGFFASSVRAHDLPLMDLDLAAMRPNCFVSPEPSFAPAPVPTVQNEAPKAGETLHILLKRVGETTDQLSREWYQSGVPFQVGRSLAAWSANAEAVELETPPLPTETASEFELASRFRSRFSEVYMPYDFAVRDWRFGQFLNLDEELPAETEGPSLADRILEPFKLNIETIALGFYLWENVECWASAEVASLELVREYSEAITTASLNTIASSDHLWTEVAAWLPKQPAAPYYEAPHLVSYELSTGQIVMLTLQQAKAWKLVASYQPEIILQDISNLPVVGYLQDFGQRVLDYQSSRIAEATEPWTNWLSQMPLFQQTEQVAAQKTDNIR